MRRWSLRIIALVGPIFFLHGAMIPVAIAQSPTSPPASARLAPHPVLSALEVGRHVTLVAAGPVWDLSLLNEGAIGSHRVIELGVDHLVLQDLIGFTRTWIPVSALRAVIWTRTDTPLPSVKPPASTGPFDRPAVR